MSIVIIGSVRRNREKQYTAGMQHPIDIDINLFDFVESRAERDPDGTVIEYKNNGAWAHFSSREFLEIVVTLAKGLIAKGVRKGDAVAIVSHTRWEWTALDMAIMAIGAVTVPVYETSSAAQIRAILNNASVTLVFAEDEGQREKIESVRSQIGTLGDVYVIERGATDIIEEFGGSVSDENFQKRRKAAHGNDLATIVYTSGSTGTPKGVELTHANFAFLCLSGLQFMPRACNIPDRGLLLFLPLSHVFARYMEILSFAGTLRLGLSSDFSTIIDDFQTFNPTLLLAVPRVFEKVYNAASQRAGSGFAGKLFKRAVENAREWSMAQQQGKHLPLPGRIRHAFYAKTVYSQILRIFGSNADFCITGGAPMDPMISHFFNGIGMPLLEGYGMTETAGPVCVSLPGSNRIGTIGQPLSGVSFGIGDDDEICIKGPMICRGYHNQPEVSADQITDGWLHTGDLGDIDAAGFLHLTGRKKDLIITAGGKNVSPGGIEASVMTSPVVDQCLVIGDRRPFVAALVTLDLSDANEWLKAQGAKPVETLEQASRNAIIHDEVEGAVAEANTSVSRAESVRKFEILPDSFTSENGLLTPSLKTKRDAIEQAYAKLIDTVIYVPRGKKSAESK
ncbi:MAG: AMP-binding protein [Bifidobacterium subtile]|nr:AMP-binding protein [Bifidobacterium subtile]MCI1241768.1 AMP-binding protein [Bifidobacterium subtile]MCI1258495.1 AMP-binding protein [Bifidobacterium subtile]